MRISHKTHNVNNLQLLTVAFDVSKDSLNCYSEFEDRGTHILEDSFANHSRKIRSKLTELEKLSHSNKLNGLHIVCEPTGGYEQKLLRIARSMGFFTSLVSGEAVCKAKVIESNDTGKTDIKDPRVIFMLATMGKTLVHRDLNREYALLRQFNHIYETEDVHRTRLKGQIHHLLIQLFCDYSFKKDFLYDKTGRVIMQTYAFNPYKIIEAGFEIFSQTVKQHLPGIKTKTLQRLWYDAESSTLHQIEPEMILLLEHRLQELWEEFLLREQRLLAIKDKMVALYNRLREKQDPVPEPRKGLMNAFIISRILGEFGNLSDFSNTKALMRYAGMNLRERKSGHYVGKVRMSKKGRSLARYVLSQAVFPLVLKKNLYGEYYHRKKQEGLSGSKAMTAVSRKFLKLFFSLSKHNVIFDKQRVFICESQYKKVA